MVDLSGAFNDLQSLKDSVGGQTVVIKFGGALAEDETIIRSIATQAAFLSQAGGAHVIIVHGGGRQINQALTDKGIIPQRDPKTDLRITDYPTLDVSDAALRTLNGQIVRIFQKVSGDLRVVGMAGYDGPAVTAKPLAAAVTNAPVNSTENRAAATQAHFTGQAIHADNQYLHQLTRMNECRVIPVIYPICHNSTPIDGESRLNVNADDVAAMIATKTNACRLILCSDIPGVLDKGKNLIASLNTNEIENLIVDGTITGGMIAKVKAAANVAESMKMGGVLILDGRNDNTIIQALQGRGTAGTLIRRSPHQPGHPVSAMSGQTL